LSSHRYQVFGLRVDSALPCPELLPVAEDSVADIRVELSPLETCLPNATFSGPRVQTAPDTYQFQIPEIARYRIEHGARILVDPHPDADEGDVRLWLLGTALGALLHQRGLLPLHVSATELNGAAIAFGGASGAGKSTLIAALHRRGLPLLTDDVGVAVPTDQGMRFYPGFPRIKLWRDALEHFGLDHRPLIPDLTRTDKYHLRVDSGFQAESLPLRRLYLLERSDEDAIRIEQLRGIEAIEQVRANTYRPGIVQRLGRSGPHLQACGRIAQQVEIYRLSRLWQLDRLDATVDRLLVHSEAASA
jgi:hypothetical protein